MSFLPDWWSQGTQGQDSNGGFGTANMFNKPTPQQQGGLGKIGALIQALRGGSDGVQQQPLTVPPQMPMNNPTPQMTPYQMPQQGPNMGAVNPNSPKKPTIGPNGQMMPNYYSDNENQINGGY